MHAARFTRTPSPEELFEILCDVQRCAELIDPYGLSDSRATMSPEMTIQSWIAILDFETYTIWTSRGEQKAVANWFSILGVEMSPDEWRGVLRHKRQRTLLDLCRDIAPRVKLQHVHEIEILGSSCLAAGVFRHLEETLKPHDTGKRFTPSLSLSELSEVALSYISLEVVKLAPGTMPLRVYRYEHEDRWTTRLSTASVVFALAAFVALIAGSIFLGLLAGISLAMSLFGCARACYRWFNRMVGEAHVEFGAMRTVADLCRAVATSQPRCARVRS